MRVFVKKEKVIALINKKETNTITITLIKKIKDFLKIKCRFNIKKRIIEKVFIKIKKGILKISIFEIKDNVKSYLIISK